MQAIFQQQQIIKLNIILGFSMNNFSVIVCLYLLDLKHYIILFVH